MMETKSEVRQDSIDRFLEHLQKLVDRSDRGALADLRAGFSEATAYRAWPHVAAWCDLKNPRQRAIWMTIAAGFAVHKGTDAKADNMGATLQRIAIGDGSQKQDDALQSFDARFRRLLTCSTAQEVCERLPGIIRATERKNIGINFRRLFLDLMRWENDERDIKVEWASRYWGKAEEGGDEY